MSTGGQKKTRLERVAALEFPPNPLERLWMNVQRFDVLVRIGMCVLSAVFLWVILGAWAPPFSFRTGYVTPRDIVARVEFHKFDPVATRVLAMPPPSKFGSFISKIPPNCSSYVAH